MLPQTNKRGGEERKSIHDAFCITSAQQAAGSAQASAHVQLTQQVRLLRGKCLRHGRTRIHLNSWRKGQERHQTYCGWFVSSEKVLLHI